VNPPGEDMTVKPVSAAPPLFAGAVNETVAAPAVVTAADIDVGAFGAVAGFLGFRGMKVEMWNTRYLPLL